MLLVQGSLAVWAGAQSLRTRPPSKWVSAGILGVTLFASLMDRPASNIWAGGPVFLTAMSVGIGLASLELWLLEPGYSRMRIPMAVAAAGLALFYFCRFLAFVVDGQNGPIFTAAFGSAVTTMGTMMVLVVASFSMAALSNEQQTRALHAAASRDGLTGLLNRKAFLDLAAEQLAEHAFTPSTGALILADLDHFKTVNDTSGHAAGDVVLQLFAQACTEAVRTSDLVGRYGGEEFVILLPGATAQRAELIAEDISRRLASLPSRDGLQLPTASYGISIYDAGTSGAAGLIAAADQAMYKAKAMGRNRAAHSDDPR
ncbi:GGDEF domain-containing protein [Pseudarthrobacter enclensis]|uniref:Diguanylate cyclase (GGDEF)-like protein n=1 Tax=Pseudarthrobacter enclensis TaxID=993070 RepID=A0ABT9RTY0_9MICC|nr:GGDEF domain-containing protein [Pseudarthrobacter enclensis]MDP9888697.1 diguanylate cyclase (GGDEF)-like protein [Pseudarthrobacter enclensis]